MVTNIEAVVVEQAAPSANSTSGVSWAAIIAGALVAAAISLIMLALGAGLGFATVNPWPGAGVTAGALTAMAGVWLVLTQWAAAGVGGYITGRMRTRWPTLHTHEVFFRDTAHGFVTWSLGAVIVALVLALAGAATVKTAANAAQGPYAYEVANLFRSNQPVATADAEAARTIITHAIANDGPSTADRAYLDQLVAARTGLPPDQAEARVNAFVADTRVVADKARKTASAAAFFTALSMLVGAFIACVAAALGGQLRDLHP